MILPAAMRNWIAIVATLPLVACHQAEPAQDAVETDVPASSSPSPSAPPIMPSMIAPVGAPPRAAAKVPVLPDEVTRLSERIASCEHFAGEEAYDADRGAFLRQQIAANCPGNAAELQKLRKKYAANPIVTKHLAALEAIDM